MADWNISTTSWMAKRTDTDDADADDEIETVEQTVTKEKRYTEHTGVAHFTDGSTRTFTFDAMVNRPESGRIVLKNYTGVSDNTDPYIGPAATFDTEAFVTLSLSGLKYFETTERVEKTMEYETTETVPIDEAEVSN